MNTSPIIKKLNECYLCNVTDNYRLIMSKSVIESPRIDMRSEEMEEIRSAVARRQTNAVISKMLVNPDVVFIKPQIPLPRALKVFTVKDIKQGANAPLKVFIDISELLYQDKDGNFKINQIDKLIAYLVSSMTQLIYNIDPIRIFSNTSMIESARAAFAQMVTYIIDYLYKISNTDISKDMCKHFASMYFDINLLRRDPVQDEDKIKSSAVKISKLADPQIELLKMYFDDTTFLNIKTFIETLAKILKIQKLSLDVFLGKWIYLYGSGTQFALEYYPSFSDLLTNVYCISYLNNQKTIEKVVGRDMGIFSSKMLALGGGLL